jgi:hypothetical protein
MKTMRELKDAVKANTPLIWCDPDPVPGNDYEITYIETIKPYFDKDTPIRIKYNKGASEAEVLISEIIIKPLSK